MTAPAQDRRGLDDHQATLPIRPPARQQNPKQPVTGSGDGDDACWFERFAFQSGDCTAGFVNECQVLLERLAKKKIARADLEKTIAEALDGDLCRCNRLRQIKYHEAVRAVVLADPSRYLS